MFMVITAMLLLAACGNSEEDPVVASGPQDGSPGDILPLSEGFEKYPVWIETEDELSRSSHIDNIYVFKKGKVTMYSLEGSSTIEDVLDLSDKELIKLAREASNEQNINSEKEIKEESFYNPDGINEIQKEFQNAIDSDGSEAYFKEQKPFTEAIKNNIEGEIPEQSPTKYTLDVTIDDLGQNTEKVDLIMPNVVSKLEKENSGASVFSQYVDFLYLSKDALELKEKDEKRFNEEKESYVEKLKEEGSFVEKDGFELNHPQNFVPNPYTWEKEDKELSIEGGGYSQKIFDTTFSGVKTSSGSLLTRVDDSFAGFKLDDPDTKGKNITIEGE
jgi:hypothetical protein